MPNFPILRRYGNIPMQPRHKRGIVCFYSQQHKEWLPFIDPDKHRFTLYQATLNSNQLKTLKTNEFTKQSCGLCGKIGHTRRSCWHLPHTNLQTPDPCEDGYSSPCFHTFKGDDEKSQYARYVLYYIGHTLEKAIGICWGSYVASGGKLGIEYLYDVGEDESITNIRVFAYKMDKDYNVCRCRKCYDYIGERLGQFPRYIQERHEKVSAIDTSELQFLDDSEIRDQLKLVEIKSDGQCPICMDEILNVDKVVTKCGHVFCASCLFQNLGTSTVCPMCRESLADFTPISRKITQLEEELELLRGELNNRMRLLRRVQTMIRENI
tara:strand:- start:610 stop:1578 length:969 start_codon:yes stop_codon:yes gene_type:complete